MVAVIDAVKKISILTVVAALAFVSVGIIASQDVQAGVSAQAAADPDVFYAFEGNLNDTANGSAIFMPPTCPTTANNVCNVSTSFGSDTKGGYFAWSANRGRGGGFSIETNTSMGTTFSIAMRMSINQTDCYRTIIDFTNGASDNHLYFCGGMQMYPLATSTFTFSPNVVYDLLLNRTSAGRFVAYVLDNTNTPVQIIDQADNSIMIPFTTASGGSRLNFFHDECCEYATGGKIYDLRIWQNRIVSAGDFSPVPQPSAPANTALPTISGTATAPQTLTASNGTWTGSPTPTYSYKWKRASSSGGSYADIASATNSTYVLTDSDVGQFIKVEVTATNSQGSSAALSNAAGAIAAAPTTTSAPTTTIRTTTTTVPDTLTIEIKAPASTTAPVGQAAVPTVAPKQSNKASTVVSTSTVPSATTTVASRVPPVVSPVPAQVSSGQAAVKLDGVSTDASISRESNAIVISTGSVKASFAGLNSSGEVSSLDKNGGIALKPGSKIRLKASGFKPNSTLSAWMFSTPRLLGSVTADSAGRIDANFQVPKDIESGQHRITIVAELETGKPVEFTLGVGVGEFTKSNNVATWLIATPIVLAILFAFFLPPAFRRRRKNLEELNN